MLERRGARQSSLESMLFLKLYAHAEQRKVYLKENGIKKMIDQTGEMLVRLQIEREGERA